MAEDGEADIFLWGTNTEGIKNDASVDLFLFDKNDEVFAAGFADELKRELLELFLFPMLRDVTKGAAKGMQIREFEQAEKEDNILQHTKLARVEHAAEIIRRIEEEESSLETFREEEHDFKPIKGVIARFTHTTLKRPFYIAKLLPSASMISGETAWVFSGNGFKPFEAAVGLRVTPDSQALIVGEDIFVFSEMKFERLFKYNAKWQSMAHKKIAEIEANFQLSFPDDTDLQSLLKNKKSLINKLQKIDPSTIKQEELMNHADELGVELMLDDIGAIIIMDGKDLTKFVNLLNDDYVTSNMTGKTYEAKNKKPLEKS